MKIYTIMVTAKNGAPNLCERGFKDYDEAKEYIYEIMAVGSVYSNHCGFYDEEDTRFEIFVVEV